LTKAYGIAERVQQNKAMQCEMGWCKERKYTIGNIEEMGKDGRERERKKERHRQRKRETERETEREREQKTHAIRRG
jgi:hypothetical protein